MRPRHANYGPEENGRAINKSGFGSPLVLGGLGLVVALGVIALVIGTRGTDESETSAAAARTIKTGSKIDVPNTRAGNVRPLPTVMAVAPDVRLGPANAPSTIPNGILKQITGPEFINYGHRLGPNSSGPWYLGLSTSPNLLAAQPAAANATPYSLEWGFDGSVIEIHVSGNGASYRLLVDGQYVTADEQRIAANDFAPHYLRIDFGSRATRRIRLEAANNLGVDSVMIGPADSVWRPAQAGGPRVMVVGDSVVEGQAGFGNIIDSFVHQLGWLMGWDDIWASGSGGTGYISGGPTGTQRVKLRDRLQSDVVKFNPDLVIIEAGYHDAASSKEEEQREASLLYAAIRRSLPNAKLIVLAPWYPSAQLSKQQTDIRDALKAAAADHADAFIDTMSGQTFMHGQALGKPDGSWITGTGAAGAPANNGNADLYIATDRIHPTPAGHTYFAQRLAAALAEILS